MPEPRFDLTTFGEMMVRLSVPSGLRLETARRLDMHPAGAESNVASLLARLGRRTRWVGGLPSNPLGRFAAHHLRLAGVDLGGVVWCERGRMGTYYVEFGEPPRGIQVTYDRADSCAARLTVDQIDRPALLDTRLLHLTGITPALSATCREAAADLVRRAHEAGVPISFDVNYRQRLWTEAEARAALEPLIQNVAVLFCSALDAGRLFGCEGSMEAIAHGMLDRSQARALVVTFGEQGALLWDGAAWHHQPARPTKIVDRLGAGDALAAGVLLGWLEGDLRLGLRYGATLAALALTQHGDMVVTTKEELLTLVERSENLTR